MSDPNAGTNPKKTDNVRRLKIVVVILIIIVFVLASLAIIAISSLDGEIASLGSSNNGLQGGIGSLQSQLFGLQQQLSSISSQLSVLPYNVTNFTIASACLSITTGCHNGTISYITIINTSNASLPVTSDYYVSFLDFKTQAAMSTNASTDSVIPPRGSGSISISSWSNVLFNGTRATMQSEYSPGDPVQITIELYSTIIATFNSTVSS